MADDSEQLTMGALIGRAAALHGPRDALVFPDRRMTYAELDARSRDWAKALIAYGVQPGDPIGLFLPTRIEFVPLFLGIAMAGAVSVLANARYQASELRYLVEDARVSLMVTAGRVSDTLDFSGRLAAALPSLADATGPALALPEAPALRGILCIDDDCRPWQLGAADLLDPGTTVSDATLDARIAAVAPLDPLMILYTSGTTAKPKGVVLSQRGQVANSRNLGRRFGTTSEDKLWSPLPIFHTGGISTMTAMFHVGGAYLTAAQFDAGEALGMLGRERATISYPSFVTLMQDLIEHPDFATTDLSAMRIMNSNLAVQPDWIREKVANALPHVIQVGTYGLTETGGAVSTSRPDDDLETRTRRSGKPLDEWEVRIREAETGASCRPGEIGEIIVRGPNLFLGYLGAPEKTAAVMRDGWFHTGDSGSIDADGNILFHGRTKDMLKVGGENVAAVEIEHLLQEHPAVKLAQVVGIPDYRYAEVPAAFVELVDGVPFVEADLIAFCRGKLANFKVPRHVRAVAEWPMSTSKIQKFRLREMLIEELDQADRSTLSRKAG